MSKDGCTDAAALWHAGVVQRGWWGGEVSLVVAMHEELHISVQLSPLDAQET